MSLLLLAILLTAGAQGDEATQQVSRQLDEIRQEYLEARSQVDIGRLVELDGRLRVLLHEPWQQHRKRYYERIWKPTWSDIGVWEGHYSDSLGYSGRLLVEAHAIDPHSPYRRYTLFSAILGEESGTELTGMPDLKITFQYLKEFPSGPFADQAQLTLGNFYNDLYKILRRLQEGRAPDYKLDCFSKYIEERDLNRQATEAQRLSMESYSRVLESRTGPAAEWEETKDIRRWLQEVKDGTATGWHFCGD